MTPRIDTRQRRRERNIIDDLPRCSKCDEINDRSPQRYCTACNRDYQTGWRRKHATVPKETLTEEQKSKLRPRRSFT